MSNIKDIECYMRRYWYRYPKEAAKDHPLPLIQKLAVDYDFFLAYGVFIIYTKKNGSYYVLYYAFDFQENLRQTMRAHREFIKGKVVYILDFKSTYKRKGLAAYDQVKRLWRFI